MVLLSYSLIAFVMGLSICVLTPLYDGRDYDDACKVRGSLVSHSSLFSTPFVRCFSSMMPALLVDKLLNCSLCRLPCPTLSFSVLAGGTFVWCSFWEYVFF